MENRKGKNVVIYKKKGVYACFPSLLKLEGDALITNFNTKIRRSHIDPTGGSKKMVSYDGGLTWSETQNKFINPKYRTSEGILVRAGAKGWRYVSSSQKESLTKEGRYIRNVRKGVIAYLSPNYYRSISTDNGTAWKTEIIKTPEYILGLMGFNESSYLVTSKGVRLVGVYGKKEGREIDETSFIRSVFFLRSTDQGKTWQFISLLSSISKEIGFGETSLIETANRKILAMMRSQPEGYLWQSFSNDEGLTWSEPEKTSMYGHPANLLNLSDGKILCTYGYRMPPMGIRACLSIDNGKTWQIENEYILRADGQGSPGNLGYPISVLLSDDSIFTIYYITLEDGITYIAGTKWQIER